jgi:glycosyltransferase involved in cell wall biosynthesis
VVAAAIPIVVVSPAEAGGAERSLAWLVGRLPDLGFSPTVVLLGPGPLEAWLAEEGCEQVVVGRGLNELPQLIRGLIDRTGARLVLSSKWNALAFGGAAASESGIPSVFWQHDCAEGSPAQMGAYGHRVAAIVCGSRTVIEAQLRVTPGAPVTRIPNGVPVGQLESRAQEAARGGRPPLVGIVGRLQADKGQHLFLEAAALVGARRADVHFLVIGGQTHTAPRYPSRLRALVAARGLEERVRFVGHQDDIVPWVSGLDVLVNASAHEPFGLVVLEAMVLGTPVVAPNLGGPAEIIQDGESGWLVAPNQPKETAEAVLAILDDPELRTRLSAAGRRRARDFTVDRMSAGFASLFRSLLDGPTPG